jgi:hypothetical protein
MGLSAARVDKILVTLAKTLLTAEKQIRLLQYYIVFRVKRME